MDEGDRAAQTSKLGSLAIRRDQERDVLILELVGELDLDGAPRLEEALREAQTADSGSIVVDLSRLEFIDSTGLRLLVMAAERSRPGQFSLLRGPRQVHRVFELTDMVDRLPFADA